MKQLTTKKSGFTLIEIIVVLIIVGILAAIALPSLFSNIKKSRSAEALATMGTYKTLIEGCVQTKASSVTTDCTLTKLVGGTSSTNFDYALTGTSNGSTDWTLTGTLKTASGGSASDTVILTKSGTSVTCSTGTGVFNGVC